MTKVLYAIAIKYHGDVNESDFISTLAHEFAGKQEVIGYLDLEHALHFNSEEDAENVLSEQPEWVHKEHIVISFNRDIFGNYWL